MQGNNEHFYKRHQTNLHNRIEIENTIKNTAMGNPSCDVLLLTNLMAGQSSFRY